jgi:hypothetical protein
VLAIGKTANQEPGSDKNIGFSKRILELETSQGWPKSFISRKLGQRLPDKSDSTFFFAGSVLVFGREQLPL